MGRRDACSLNPPTRARLLESCMWCGEHERLRDEENRAWAVWRNLKDTMPKYPTEEQSKELSRLAANAVDASHVRTVHLKACRACNREDVHTAA